MCQLISSRIQLLVAQLLVLEYYGYGIRVFLYLFLEEMVDAFVFWVLDSRVVELHKKLITLRFRQQRQRR